MRSNQWNELDMQNQQCLITNQPLRSLSNQEHPMIQCTKILEQQNSLLTTDRQNLRTPSKRFVKPETVYSCFKLITSWTRTSSLAWLYDIAVVRASSLIQRPTGSPSSLLPLPQVWSHSWCWRSCGSPLESSPWSCPRRSGRSGPAAPWCPGSLQPVKTNYMSGILVIVPWMQQHGQSSKTDDMKQFTKYIWSMKVHNIILQYIYFLTLQMTKLQNKKFCKASITMNNKLLQLYPKASAKTFRNNFKYLYGSKYNIDHG